METKNAGPERGPVTLERIGVDESVEAAFPPALLVEALSDVPPEVSVVDGSSDALADLQAVVTLAYRPPFLELEWVHSIQAGVDRFPVDEFRAAGVTFTNSSGIHGDAIGESVAGAVLALARGLHHHMRQQERRTWSTAGWEETWTVAGERACVVGLGSLGRGVVDRLKALGLRVVGVRRTPVPEPGVDHVYPPSELNDAVANARFVVLTVPLTDTTRALVDADVLDAMRDDSYLVNVARGAVVDQSALVEALRENRVAGAALDVFETEPLPESSPLWDMDDVIVTPHSAGRTRDYYRHVAALVRKNVQQLNAGEDIANRVC